jgi:hypothetical protein
MELDKYFKRIDKYLESDALTPIIVDVPEWHSLNAITQHYNVGTIEFIDASLYCQNDGTPHIDKLLNSVQRKRKRMFLTGLSSFLKLQGKVELCQQLQSLLDLTIEGKLIVMTYQCASYLRFRDPRVVESGRVLMLDDSGIKPELPILYFVKPELKEHFDLCIPGINMLSIHAEREVKEVKFLTAKRKADFPSSLYDIREFVSSYDILVGANPELANIQREWGTEEDWLWLSDKIDEEGSWADFVENNFIGLNKLLQYIHNIGKQDSNMQWAFFIAMKAHGVANNEYLSKVVIEADSMKDFQSRIYDQILSADVKDPNFEKLYAERKTVITDWMMPGDVVGDFCKKVKAKGGNALFYLTDTTIMEKEMIIETICENSGQWDKRNLEKALNKVYPDLFSYLYDFQYPLPKLTEYFNAYKFNKLTNQITPEFRTLVDRYAVDRFYYKEMSRRSSLVDKLDSHKSRLYFVDAMGVEFLHYLQDLCYARNLSFDVDCAYCELPSITSFNKDFVSHFSDNRSIKELDTLKHDGTNGYDYQQTHLPRHIIKELGILKDVVEHIEKDLNAGEVEKVYIISDHGASRLAVINETENKWEVKEKGLHSGRCCPKSDLDEKPDFAAEDNDFWCLANYDRFKGGRKANVEVHGGATLEEVIVPIIAVAKAMDRPKCEIVDEFKIITVSFKKKAKIRLFIAKNLSSVRVCVDGKYYDAVPTDQKYFYDVDMPDVKRGMHLADVYDGSTRIAEGLEFEAKSAGASENRYF